MKNVIINGLQCKDLDTPIKLNNGALVIQKDRAGYVLGTYIVTSFRNNKGFEKRWDNTAQYCSLINLDDGKIKFEEPSSRSTTTRRLLKHLTNQYNMDSVFKNQDIEIYCNGDYKISISLPEREERLNG